MLVSQAEYQYQQERMKDLIRDAETARLLKDLNSCKSSLWERLMARLHPAEVIPDEVITHVRQTLETVSERA